MASVPRATERWCVLRFVLRESGYRLFLEDRLVNEESGERADLAGLARITLGPEAHLASVRLDHLAPEDPLFEPVPLRGYANAAQIRGERLDRRTLPPAGRLVTVNGIPFVFAEPDERGNDHIDLESSWVYFANFEGYLQTPMRWGPSW